MLDFKIPPEQTDPPRSPRETLPTMYDLPSEDPEEPGVPEFHLVQGWLLRYTFWVPNYSAERVFVARNMRLYYDVNHPLWHKRPDWFGVVGVPRLYNGTDMRLSYVVWQEGVNPYIVVELLSPGTENEDLGQTTRAKEKPPTKWEVYERILRVPYYVIFSRYTNELRAYRLMGGKYQELELSSPTIWMPGIELGLGLWQGEYAGVDRLWLRWYDAEGNLILTPEEAAEQQAQAAQQQAEAAQQRAEAERQRAEEAEARVQALQQRLQELGIDPNSGE